MIPGGVSPSRQASVLVVEDDAALRTLFLALLTRHGYKVVCVNDGAEALDRLADGSYSVMLLDLMMPVTNGFDVIRRLETTKPALLRQTIVTTGVSERELRKLDTKNVFAVLRKPFDIDRLVATIRDCERQSHKRRTRRKRVRDNGDDAEGEAKFAQSVRRFEAALHDLRSLLSDPAASADELMLRHELRRAVAQVGRILFHGVSAGTRLSGH